MRRLCNALMTQSENAAAWPNHKPTALLVLADGTVLEGFGLGAEGQAVGEVCFNTAMTGYEEILTDPSYAGQLITFTFPHIGNVGTNDEDIEPVNMAATPGARGVLLGPAIRLGGDAVGMGRRLWPADRARFQRCRDRVRHQAQHPAAPGR